MMALNYAMEDVKNGKVEVIKNDKYLIIIEGYK